MHTNYDLRENESLEKFTGEIMENNAMLEQKTNINIEIHICKWDMLTKKYFR